MQVATRMSHREFDDHDVWDNHGEWGTYDELDCVVPKNYNNNGDKCNYCKEQESIVQSAASCDDGMFF